MNTNKKISSLAVPAAKADKLKAKSPARDIMIDINGGLPGNTSVAVVAEEASPWAKAREFLEQAKRFEQCKVWCQVMLGFELVGLKKSLGVKRGGDHTSDRYSTSKLSRESLLSWEDELEKNLGMSAETGYRYIRLAEAAKKRLKKVPEARELLDAIIDQPINELSLDQAETLSKFVHKLTDGKTQMEFMLECGTTKSATPAKGGKLGAQSTEPPADEAVEEARAVWEPVHRTFVTDAEQGTWKDLPEGELEGLKLVVRNLLARWDAVKKGK